MTDSEISINLSRFSMRITWGILMEYDCIIECEYVKISGNSVIYNLRMELELFQIIRNSILKFIFPAWQLECSRTRDNVPKCTLVQF